MLCEAPLLGLEILFADFTAHKVTPQIIGRYSCCAGAEERVKNHIALVAPCDDVVLCKPKRENGGVSCFVRLFARNVPDVCPLVASEFISYIRIETLFPEGITFPVVLYSKDPNMLVSTG